MVYDVGSDIGIRRLAHIQTVAKQFILHQGVVYPPGTVQRGAPGKKKQGNDYYKKQGNNTTKGYRLFGGLPFFNVKVSLSRHTTFPRRR